MNVENPKWSIHHQRTAEIPHAGYACLFPEVNLNLRFQIRRWFIFPDEHATVNCCLQKLRSFRLTTHSGHFANILGYVITSVFSFVFFEVVTNEMLYREHTVDEKLLKFCRWNRSDNKRITIRYWQGTALRRWRNDS